MISSPDGLVLDQVLLDAAWHLVETFATMPRWLSQDVNRAAAPRLNSLPS